jgi:hypothetical protein
LAFIDGTEIKTEIGKKRGMQAKQKMGKVRKKCKEVSDIESGNISTFFN